MKNNDTTLPAAAAAWLAGLPWWLLVAGSLTLGLAPFVPEPHLVEKIRMLAAGELTRPLDIFDLLLHAAFPALLAARAVQALRARVSGRQG